VAAAQNSAPKGAMKWDLERNWDSKSPKRCRASSPTFQVDQHDYTTQVWLDIVDHQLYVNTTTNLNIKKSGVGVKAGNSKLKGFSSKTSDTGAVWGGDIEAAIKKYKNIEIHIGGSSLGNKTQQAKVSLDGLKAIYSLYSKCAS